MLFWTKSKKILKCKGRLYTVYRTVSRSLVSKASAQWTCFAEVPLGSAVTDDIHANMLASMCLAGSKRIFVLRHLADERCSRCLPQKAHVSIL